MCRILLNNTKDLFTAPFKEKGSALTQTLQSFESSNKSSSSQRSKFISKSKLTKSNLFTALSGKKLVKNEEKSQEVNLQMSLLEDSLSLVELNGR